MFQQKKIKYILGIFLALVVAAWVIYMIYGSEHFEQPKTSDLYTSESYEAINNNEGQAEQSNQNYTTTSSKTVRTKKGLHSIEQVKIKGNPKTGGVEVEKPDFNGDKELNFLVEEFSINNRDTAVNANTPFTYILTIGKIKKLSFPELLQVRDSLKDSLKAHKDKDITSMEKEQATIFHGWLRDAG